MQGIFGEQNRLAALRNLDLLDTAPEEPFDSIVQLVLDIFSVPICAISLIGSKRQWFKSSVGLHTCETSRDIAFCDHTISGEGVLVVNDAWEDARFTTNPLVTAGPRIRFYAGAIIRSRGLAIGAVCICDKIPRLNFSVSDERRLQGFADLVSQLLVIRKEGWPEARYYQYLD